MKNSYKNKMRALCLSIVLVSAVSAVEETKPSVKTKKESQDQNQKKTLTKKEMAQQKSDDEFLNARIKKNQKNTLNKEEECKNEVDSLGERNLLVIGEDFAGVALKSMITLEYMQPKNRSDYSCFNDFIKENSKGKFQEIVSNEVYQYKGLVKDKENAFNEVLTRNHNLFGENMRQLVDQLEIGGFLNTRVTGATGFYNNTSHTLTVDVAGQYCYINRKSDIVCKKADSNLITDIFKGTDLLQVALNAFSAINKDHNMTVIQLFEEIISPLVQMMSHDKVMANLGMERVDYGQRTPKPGNKPNFYATYKKVGEPVKSDSVPGQTRYLLRDL